MWTAYLFYLLLLCYYKTKTVHAYCLGTPTHTHTQHMVYIEDVQNELKNN